MRPEGLTSIGCHINHPRSKQKGEPVNEEIVEICKDYLQKNYRKIDKFNKKITSYRLKHKIEKAIRYYVSNGEAIAAAADLGYDVESDGISPNAIFNIEEYDPFDDWLSRKNV